MNRIFLVIALWALMPDYSIVLAGSTLPPIHDSTSDEHGRITVNGKLFFPILMYDVPTDPASLKMFREHGFNTLLGKPEVADRLLVNGFYTAVHVTKDPVKNLDGVLFGVGFDSPALFWKQDLLQKAKADLARMRRLVPNRAIMNAIGYWENEPEGVYTNKVPTKERYEELVKVLDVSAPYLYPIPYHPVRSVGEALKRANRATSGKKPLLPILQLFTWQAKDRYPTSAELRCMAYLSLIHGATGIGYYSYTNVTGKKGTNIAKEQPELWQTVKQINSEIAAVSALLLENNHLSVVLQDGAPEVEFRAVKGLKKTLLLLANTANVAKTAVLRFPLPVVTNSSRTLKLLGGEKPILIEDSQVRISLEPHQALALIE